MMQKNYINPKRELGCTCSGCRREEIQESMRSRDCAPTIHEQCLIGNLTYEFEKLKAPWFESELRGRWRTLVVEFVHKASFGLGNRRDRLDVLAQLLENVSVFLQNEVANETDVVKEARFKELIIIVEKALDDEFAQRQNDI